MGSGFCVLHALENDGSHQWVALEGVGDGDLKVWMAAAFFFNQAGKVLLQVYPHGEKVGDDDDSLQPGLEGLVKRLREVGPGKLQECGAHVVVGAGGSNLPGQVLDGTVRALHPAAMGKQDDSRAVLISAHKRKTREAIGPANIELRYLS